MASITTQLIPAPVLRVYDNSGNLAIGGMIYTYLAGTTTPVATYTDATGNTQNTNPIILNSRGECQIWITASNAFKLVAEDAQGNLLWTSDYVNAQAYNGSLNVVSLYNFLTLTQQTALNNGQPALNCATQVTAAIASFTSAGGILMMPGGIIECESTIVFNKPILVQGLGSGLGPNQALTTPAASAFYCSGSLTDFIQFGGFGTTFSGGGFQNLAILGAGSCFTCLHVEDHQHLQLDNVLINGASFNQGAINYTNTPGQPTTGYTVADNLVIDLSGTSSPSAHGITMLGTGSGTTDGIAYCDFRNTTIYHVNGDGVRLGLRAAYCNWHNLKTTATNSGTGIGFDYQNLGATQQAYGHTFTGLTSLSAGMVVGYPGTATGSCIENLKESTPQNLGITGNGAFDISVLNSMEGGKNGSAAFAGGLIQYSIDDPMSYVFYDSVNGVLHTTAGNYSATGSGSENFSATTGAHLSGGTLFTTAASTNSYAIVQDNFRTYSKYSPRFVFQLDPVTLTNVVYTMGFRNPSGSVTDGAYVQFNPSVSANYQFVVLAGSNVSSLDTGLAPIANQSIHWDICLNANSASLRWELSGSWSTPLVITTNIPATSTFLQGFFTLTTTTSSAATAAVLSWKRTQSLIDF